MFGSGSNSAFPLPPKSKNVAGNITNIGWKHETNASGNENKVKYNYCSKTFNGDIFHIQTSSCRNCKN